MIKKIKENLKHVHPVGGDTTHFVNGGAHPPRTYDFSLVKELKEEASRDRNTDTAVK